MEGAVKKSNKALCGLGVRYPKDPLLREAPAGRSDHLGRAFRVPPSPAETGWSGDRPSALAFAQNPQGGPGGSVLSIHFEEEEEEPLAYYIFLCHEF